MRCLKHAGAWTLCALALWMAGCASAYKTTAASLTAAEQIVQAAAEQLPDLDMQKRLQIVSAGGSREEIMARMDDWNVQVEKIVRAIEGAHASIKLGADGLKGVRDGLRDPKQLGSWIGPAIRVGVDLLGLLNALGIHIKVQ